MLSRLLMQCLKVDSLYHDTRPLRFLISLTAIITAVLFLSDTVVLPGYNQWHIEDFVPSKCLPMIYGILGVLGVYFSSSVSAFTFTKSRWIKPIIFSLTHLGIAFVNTYATIAAFVLEAYTPFLPAHIAITIVSLWVLAIHPFVSKRTTLKKD